MPLCIRAIRRKSITAPARTNNLAELGVGYVYELFEDGRHYGVYCTGKTHKLVDREQVVGW